MAYARFKLLMQFRKIEFSSADYALACQLREQVLRMPLGLRLTAHDVVDEVVQWHYGVFNDAQLLACLVIKPLDNSATSDSACSKPIVKLRQMAVLPTHQGKGLGKLLVISTEQALAELGIKQIELNARQTAIGFYQRLDYQPSGDLFIEIGIPHILMKKALTLHQALN